MLDFQQNFLFTPLMTIFSSSEYVHLFVNVAATMMAATERKKTLFAANAMFLAKYYGGGDIFNAARSTIFSKSNACRCTHIVKRS